MIALVRNELLIHIWFTIHAHFNVIIEPKISFWIGKDSTPMSNSNCIYKREKANNFINMDFLIGLSFLASQRKISIYSENTKVKIPNIFSKFVHFIWKCNVCCISVCALCTVHVHAFDFSNWKPLTEYSFKPCI